MANDAQTTNHPEAAPLEGHPRFANIINELRLARANLGEFLSHVAHDVMEHKPVENRLADLRSNLQKNYAGMKENSAHGADVEHSISAPADAIAQQSSKTLSRII